MIKSITVENFYSFAEETLLSFEMGKKPAPTNFDINLSGGKRINKAIAVIGPNGAGKTQIIKPFAFISWFINDSFVAAKPDALLPFQPHALHSANPTSIRVNFVIDGKEYKYELEVTRDTVIKEALYKKTSKLFSYLFVREVSADGYNYKQQNFGFTTAQAKTLRTNASVIATALNHNVEQATLFANFFARIGHNLHVHGRYHFSQDRLTRTAEYFASVPDLKDKMSHALCEFDLGISSVEIRKQEFTNEQGDPYTTHMPYAKHDATNAAFELPLFLESSGSQSAFVLLGHLLPILKTGGLAVIDEIDNDLHPHMLSVLLDWFRFEHTNPHNAQLIFTCHTPEVLNIFMKHQVYLVEKQEQQSEAWRLDQVEGLRADDNLYAKYMAGALSAVPNL